MPSPAQSDPEQSDPTPFDPVPSLAEELSLPLQSVAAVVGLLSEGNTIPFIARYRKEVTNGLDEVQIRAIQERNEYLCELENRRRKIIATIDEQGALTDDLRQRLLTCSSKTDLEDLYLPYKPKRRTRASMARERGLEPLAEWMRTLPRSPGPEEAARKYVDPNGEVPDVESALAGARDIIAESIAENAETRALVRDAMTRHGVVTSKVVRGKKEGGEKFELYFDYRESVKSIPSHRYLAILRGENEKILRMRIELDHESLLSEIRRRSGWRDGTACSGEIATAIEDSMTRLLHPSLESDVCWELKQAADRAAVEVFANNLENLLLAAPLGSRSVIGIDPGIRTGCKCVSVDDTGKLLHHITIYPVGRQQQDRAAGQFLEFLRKFNPRAIAIGNGTGGRETEAFVRKLTKEHDFTDTLVLSVNEAGASIYSASDIAREEFPDLDLTIRGAISIARRLQDPLAELVKIDPRSIGVGQYQHDVHQPTLKRKLDEVVESCVNRVGVELNTASAPLLSYVAGIGLALAKKIVGHREQHGPFSGRKRLLQVSGLGKRAFEQAAGFIRVRGGDHPLDQSAVHPERYSLVESMARDLEVGVADLVQDGALPDRIAIDRYVDDEVGEPTLRDIIQELKKPGRDPRADFSAPQFRDDVHSLDDLREGMTLEGVVTNVTDFGAFVDIGVHQDGLVHISQLADHFVRDPKEVVSAGQTITVRVLSVDAGRKRIGLTAKKA